MRAALYLSPLFITPWLVVVACQLETVKESLPPAPNVASASTSTAPPPVAEEAGPTVPVEAGPCSLQQQGVNFPNATCHACMQTSCCDVTTTCFGSAGCAALYNCINACPSRGLGPGTGTGSGTGDGGGGGGDGGAGGGGGADAGDAGPDPCVADCETKAPAEVANARAFIKCYATSCVTACR